MATYELIIDNAKLDVAPYINPLLLSTPDEDGWHGAADHMLIDWSDTMAVAIYTDRGESAASIRSVHVAGNGSLSMGPYTSFAEDATWIDSGRTNRGCRVGDKIVYWKSKTGGTPATSNWLYTFQLDESTDTWSLVNTTQVNESTFIESWVPFGNPYGSIAMVDSDTMLMLGQGYVSGNSGRAMFAKWNGSSWDFSSVYSLPSGSYFDGTDSPDVINSRAGQCVGFVSTSSDTKYALISGEYPDAPTVHISNTIAGVVGYFNKELNYRAVDGDAMRMVPLTLGTTTPILTGSDLFDWGVMPLDTSSGEVVEGSITNVGTSDDWYDIAAAQLNNGDIWAVHEKESSPDVWGQVSLEIWKVGDTAPTNTISYTDVDSGIRGNDVWIRCAVPVGNYFLICWYTIDNEQYWVQSFPVQSED